MAEKQLGFGWQEDEPTPLRDGGNAGKSDGILPGIAPLARRLGDLARRGVFIGTSSWKYPGWLGKVYDPARYATRGKIAKTRFDRGCLEEYARVFPAVGGDFSFYRFPSDAQWERLFEQVPEGFKFGLKVPEEITVERFSKQARHGARAGQDNPGFMDAGLLKSRFLDPLEPHRDKVGVIMFEFGQVHRGSFATVERFTDALDAMLTELPTDRFRFAVEIRNRAFLDAPDDYLACLRSHRVAHCFNSWTRMPPVDEQLRIPGIFTADHTAARFLLQPGRPYRQAVDMFSPYETVQDPYPQGRDAMSELIERCLGEQRMLFAFVNNRFEGNAPETIDDVTGEIAI